MNNNLENYQSFHKYLDQLENVYLNFGPVKDINVHILEQKYISNIFRHIEKNIEFEQNQFYLISANSNHEYKINDKSIVIYLSNEDHFIPPNILKAKVVFTPYCPVIDKNRPKNCFPIPLGYNGSLVEVPFKSMKSRNNDVFFSGNIHKRRISFFMNSWIWMKKENFRNIFREDRTINKLLFTRKFTGGLTPEEYSAYLMDSRIALVPEGYKSNISFRFFEAAKFGCVIITPKLYNYWFFRDFPGIQLDGWSQMNNTLKRIIGNQTILNEIQMSTLDYYDKNCSEKAVGDFILDKL